MGLYKLYTICNSDQPSRAVATAAAAPVVEAINDGK